MQLNTHGVKVCGCCATIFEQKFLSVVVICAASGFNQPRWSFGLKDYEGCMTMSAETTAGRRNPSQTIDSARVNLTLRIRVSPLSICH